MAETKPVVTYETFKQHVSKDNLYLLIHGKVYDVSKFIDEHPGGDEVMLAEAGKDATEAFEDVGHSEEARDIMKDLCAGDFEGADEFDLSGASLRSSGDKATSRQESSGAIAYFIPLACLGAYFAWRFYSS